MKSDASSNNLLEKKVEHLIYIHLIDLGTVKKTSSIYSSFFSLAIGDKSKILIVKSIVPIKQ